MALFQYSAINNNGKKIIGLINADSFEVAKKQLLQEKILIVKLTLYNKQLANHILSPSLLLNFTRDLHVLLRAGLPLYDSMLTLQEKYSKTKAHFLLLNLSDN